MKKNLAPIKIVIADDHEVLRVGFCSIIKKYAHIEVIAEAENGIQAVEYATGLQPDVTLMDIKMPLMNGIEATRAITKSNPHITVVAFSMFDDENLIADMLEAGAKGYLVKNAHKTEIIEAIEAAKNGDSYFSNDISIKLMRLIAKNRPGKYTRDDKIEFSIKEKQVIELICRQFFTKEISEMMNLSTRTVEGYRESILRKINARNTAGIVLYAVTNKLYDPGSDDVKDHPGNTRQ
ncbi:MAG: response regulator transcription factor [Ferruginibacter sp.]